MSRTFLYLRRRGIQIRKQKRKAFQELEPTELIPRDVALKSKKAEDVKTVKKTLRRSMGRL